MPPREPLIYLDHLATTPLDGRVLQVMNAVWRDHVGNAASNSHQAGHRARELVESCRARIADAVGCEPGEVIFTSGATEANNLAIKGMFCGAAPAHLITNAAEHRAVLDPARRLRRGGQRVTILPVDQHARVDPDQLIAEITSETKLVSVMLANNEVGTINDLKSIAARCRDAGVFVHSDASQAVGKIPVNLNDLPVDLLSFTAHKLYGPQGIGALVVRKSQRRIPLQPLLDGGGHEQGLRSGTLPVALIAGFAEAVAIALASQSDDAEHLAALRNRLWDLLSQRIPGVRRNGDPHRSLPGNLNVTLPDIDGEALLAHLQNSPLCISSGSACTSADPEPSHVLRAMGLDDRQAKASLRFGIGRGNTPHDIDRAVEILANAVQSVTSNAPPNAAVRGE